MDKKQFAKRVVDDAISPQEFLRDLKEVLQTEDQRLIHIAKHAFMKKCMSQNSMDMTALSDALDNIFEANLSTYLLDLAIASSLFMASGEHECESERARVVLRLIKANPEDPCLSAAPFSSFPYPDLLDVIGNEWKLALTADPSNPRVLANAAQFYVPFDEQEAERLLNRGHTLDPENPFWVDELDALKKYHS